MKIKAIVHQAEEGGYWAEVPALPGCITEGDTIEELESNLKDAIQGWMEVANQLIISKAIAFLITSTRAIAPFQLFILIINLLSGIIHIKINY
jgi:predicted RNase H-like HicB family nuclease